MEIIKRFLTDKSRLAVLAVCLLIVSIVMASSLTGGTLAASDKMCLQCNNNPNVTKVGTSINPDSNCTVTYKEVDPSVCGASYTCVKCKANVHLVKWRLDWYGLAGDSDCSGGYKSTSLSKSQCVRYTVSYNANGGSNAPSMQYKAYGESLTLSAQKPVMSGYTFLGWNTNPNTSTVVYKPGTTLTTNANVQLYAVWGEPSKSCFKCKTNAHLLKWKTSNVADSNCSAGYDKVSYSEESCQSYTISYNANGGTNAPATQYKAKGVNLTLSSAEPERNGYEFLGWVISAKDTSVDWLAGATYAVDESRVLYALWHEVDSGNSGGGGNTTVTNKVIIKYNPNGGNVATNTDAGSWKVANNLIYKNDNLLTTIVDYGSKLGTTGLIDYYSGTNLRVTKT